MKTTRTLYMHLLDGEPAEFQDYGAASYLAIAAKEIRGVATSLRQLRSEQMQCMSAHRREIVQQKLFHELAGLSKRYGYIRVKVPR